MSFFRNIFRIPKTQGRLEENAYIFPEKKEKGIRQDRNELYAAASRYMTLSKPYLDPNLTLDQVAHAIRTNRLYLSRAVNDCAGMGFPRYVNWYRIKYAVDMMERDRRLKIEEVSKLCGFNSQPTFNHWFKLNVGMTPSEYLRKLNRRRPRPRDLSSSGEGER